MSQIPENEVTAADMAEWTKLQAELARIKAAEMLLRTKIYKKFFPSPDEGTNTVDLSDGWVIKGKRTIDRKIDLPLFQMLASGKRTATGETAEQSKFEVYGIKADELIQWEPKLVLKKYRELTAEQLALFDQCLTIKDGSPALEIVLSAAAAKAKAAQVVQ